MVKIIKNGRVIDPESRFDGRADLWIENGKIQKIVKKDTKSESDEASDAPFIPADAEVLDAEGLIVAPGLVDVHVHFRDPGLTYKEDIETGAAAAKAGGFTTVVCMANTKPVADTPEIVRYILEKGAKTGIHVETCAAVSKGFQGKELTKRLRKRHLQSVAANPRQKLHLRKKRLLQNGAVSPRQKRQRSRLKSPPASPAPGRRTRPKNKAGPNQHC